MWRWERSSRTDLERFLVWSSAAPTCGRQNWKPEIVKQKINVSLSTHLWPPAVLRMSNNRSQSTNFNQMLFLSFSLFHITKSSTCLLFNIPTRSFFQLSLFFFSINLFSSKSMIKLQSKVFYFKNSPWNVSSSSSKNTKETNKKNAVNNYEFNSLIFGYYFYLIVYVILFFHFRKVHFCYFYFQKLLSSGC